LFTSEWVDVGVAIELCPLEPCDDDPPELCALELEPEPPELWPPPEPLEPPEEPPPCEPPPPPLEPPELPLLELPPPPPPEECCAKVTTDRRRTAAVQRLESRIKHLVPTERYSADQAGDAMVSFGHFVQQKGTPKPCQRA